MPEFSYQGINKAGKLIKGKMDARDEGELRMNLRADGIRPIKVSQGENIADMDVMALLGGGMRSVPVQALVSFTRQLQVLIGSGIPVVQALEILSDQTSDSSLKKIIITIKDKISQGAYLWESFNLYPLVFPKLYIALIRAGEASGSLDAMLKRLSRYLEDSDRLRKMVKSASMYPIIVMSIGSGVVALMLIFVIPKFEEMLSGSHQSLPYMTQLVIDASHFLTRNILYILGIGFGFFYLIRRYLKTPEGRGMLDRLVFKLPFFGAMAQKSGIARFSRTLNTLLSSGVNLVDAIDICTATMDNAVLEESVRKIRTEIEAGKTLGAVIGKMNVFPKMAVQMISVGESTGNIDKMLEKVADFYEGEVEILIGGISKLIEPFVLVFLGGAVGGMMIAMYLPIFKLAGGAD